MFRLSLVGRGGVLTMEQGVSGSLDGSQGEEVTHRSLSSCSGDQHAVLMHHWSGRQIVGLGESDDRESKECRIVYLDVNRRQS